MNTSHLPAAGWDLVSFIENATDYAELVGAGVVALLGTVAVFVGAVFLITKLMSQRDQRSWLTIVLLIFIGGAFMVGGFSLIADIAAGGQTTIEDMGGGS